MTPPPEQQETDQSTKEVEGAPEKSRPSTTHSNNWLEVAVAAFGPITADIADISRDHFHYSQQLHFLREHDTLLKRLWFLWKPEELSNKLAADRAKSAICGCVGGCKFFGSNVNGVKFFTTQTLDAGEGKFSRYGSESLWGGSHEKQGMKKRMIGRSGSVSIAGSSLGLRKKQADHRRSASLGGRLRSQKGNVPGVISREFLL